METFNGEFDRARLLSLGYEEEHADALTTVQSTILCGALQLAEREAETGGEPAELLVRMCSDAEEPLLHDDPLVPLWERFAEALSSVPPCRQGFIRLAFGRIRLGKAVTDVLLRSFATAPLSWLMLVDLGREGVQFGVDAMKRVATLELLSISHTRIESVDDATSLVDAVIKHPRVAKFFLTDCGIGRNHDVMTILFASLNHLSDVDLEGNGIGSDGARLISAFLASNPHLEHLFLDRNLLNNDDAKLLSRSLKTNTKLRHLGLKENQMTHVGIRALGYAVYNSDLNALSDANHTCFIAVENALLSHINWFVNPGDNRNFKILVALLKHRILLTADVHIKIMPNVLAFVQGSGLLNPAKYNALDEVFQFLSKWNMPLLYTSDTGPEPRRSERLRKKMVLRHMGKK